MKSIKTGRLRIGGMTCISCQNKIEKALNNTEGVSNVKVSYSAGTVELAYDAQQISLGDIRAIIQKLGYEVPEENKKESGAPRAVGLLLVIAALYWLLQQFGILNLLVPSRLAEAGMGFGMLFVIGLITSVHCVAMCGGISLSQCIPQSAISEPGRFAALRPSFLYNLGRVISYTVVGFLVGALGATITFSNTLQGVLKLIAGVFMVIMGINMLGIFPALRKLNLRMPRFFTSRIAAEKGKSSHPLVVGLLNGLMPCGPLQAMQLYALSTGNPFTGAASMLVFSLGTVPLMFGLGAFSTVLGRRFTHGMMRVGAVLVAVLGLSMLSQGWSLSGVRMPAQFFQTASSARPDADASAVKQPQIKDGVQVIQSTLSPGRYPSITVQAGIPVKWVIDAPKGSINGCNNRMFIGEYDIEYAFEPGENIITFTPTEAGQFRYSCWMGMIRGLITVTQDGADEASADTSSAAAAQAKIPTDNVAIATREQSQDGSDIQTVELVLTKDGFSPAIAVVERGIYTKWIIRNQASKAAELIIPSYAAQLALEEKGTALGFPAEISFDFYTGDKAFYGYIKVVESLDAVDIDAIKAEVAAYTPLTSSQEEFFDAGDNCCG